MEEVGRGWLARCAEAVLHGVGGAVTRWMPTTARALQVLAAFTLAVLAAQLLLRPLLWRGLTLPALAWAGAAVFTFALAPVLWGLLRLPTARARGMAGPLAGAVCCAAWLGLANVAVTVMGAGFRVEVLAAIPFLLLWLAAACGLGLLAPRAMLTEGGTVSVLMVALMVRDLRERRMVTASLAGGLAVAGAVTAGAAVARAPTLLAAGLASVVALAVLTSYWMYSEFHRAAADTRAAP